jgi:hypothetical protein
MRPRRPAFWKLRRVEASTKASAGARQSSTFIEQKPSKRYERFESDMKMKVLMFESAGLPQLGHCWQAQGYDC